MFAVKAGYDGYINAGAAAYAMLGAVIGQGLSARKPEQAMTMEMISYTLTREAYTAYNLYYLVNSPSMKRLMRLCQFVPPLLVMALCGVLYLMSRITVALASAVSVVTYGAFVLFFPMVFKYSLKRRLGRMLDEGVGLEFIGEHLLELKASGLQDSISGHVMEVPYASLERAVENDGHLYLFIGPAMAFVIPLDALGGKKGKPAFLAALAAKGAPIDKASFA